MTPPRRLSGRPGGLPRQPARTGGRKGPARAGGKPAAAELGAQGRAVPHVAADLGSLESVRSAAAGIRDRLGRGGLPPLRGFAGNAGMQYTNALPEGPEGFESAFTVSVLAHHLFVRLLQDRFTPPARTVVTTGDTHFGDLGHNLGMVPGPVRKSPDVLARTGACPRPESTAAGRTAYSTSKPATIHPVHEYARRLPAGIDVIACKPGCVPGTGPARKPAPALPRDPRDRWGGPARARAGPSGIGALNPG
ncbi:hypothetical protein [Streptomyces glaucus]